MESQILIVLLGIAVVVLIGVYIFSREGKKPATPEVEEKPQEEAIEVKQVVVEEAKPVAPAKTSETKTKRRGRPQINNKKGKKTRKEI
jgi:Flp pilus assembly protein CpaB